MTTTTVTEETLEASLVYSVIHGEAGGTSVTLIDCLTVQRQLAFFDAHAYEAIHVSQVFKGAWYDAEPDANSLSVTMEHASHWVMHRPRILAQLS